MFFGNKVIEMHGVLIFDRATAVVAVTTYNVHIIIMEMELVRHAILLSKLYLD